MSNKLISLILAILLSIAVGFAVYFWQQAEMTPATENTTEETSPPPNAAGPVEDPSEPEISEEKETQMVKDTVQKLSKEYYGEPGTFTYDEANYTYHGEFDALGYVTTEFVNEAFCTEDCKTFKRAFFNILETQNKPIKDYIAESEGNSFIGDMSITIGCFTDNDLLWRLNHSDELGMQKYQNSASSSETLLNSSPTNIVKVNLERYLFTGGGGAPDCYSHFAEVKVAE